MSDKKSIIEKVAEEKEAKLKEESQKDEYRNKLSSWRANGWNVSKLEKVIEKDLETVEKEFNVYEENMKKLLELSNKLEYLDIRGLEQDMQAIQTRLNDPYAFSDIEQKIKELEQKIELRKEGEGKEEEQRPSELEAIEEERKRLETTQQVAQENLLKANVYITETGLRMKQYIPEYSPLGYNLINGQWSVNVNPDNTRLAGKLSKGFMKTLLTLNCEYIAMPELLANLQNYLIEKADIAMRKNQFTAICYIGAGVKESAQDRTFKNFSHPHLSAYLYDIKTEQLIYNENDEKTKFFAEWFKKDGNPKSLKDLIVEIADKNGIFTEQGLEEKLHFSKKEAELLLRDLIKKNVIVEVSKHRGEYGLV